MSSDTPTAAEIARPTIFLSYATQDRPAARALLEALSAFGLEVWLDESELGGGDAWDQKIRRQIRECQYFMPLVSAQTEARVEGYFRREWRLAVERSLDMADDHLFLLPITIDGTDQAKARVPEKFLTVQWLSVPGGRTTPGLENLCRRLVSGETGAEPSPRKVRAAVRKLNSKALPDIPAFPTRTPDQKRPYGIAVLAWAGQASWAGFRRLPRWARIVISVWLSIAVLSRIGDGDRSDAPDITPASAAKIKAIAEQYQGSSNKADIARLGVQIAREFAGDAGTGANLKSPLLAIPFTAPAGDAAGEKLADATFAMVYGRVAVSRRGRVALAESALASNDMGAAIERGRAQHASYVLFGAVENPGPQAVLAVKIAAVEDPSVRWAKSYPLTGADPATIAAEVETKVPALEE